MLRILIAVVVGIAIADCVVFPLWSIAVGFVVLVAAAWIFRRRAVGSLYVLAAAMAAAILTSSLTHSDHNIQSTRPSTLGLALQRKATSKVEQLGLEQPIEAIVKGVSTGERSGITTTQWRDYRLSGGAHLLAVSGLHIGFVFVMVNFLLTGVAIARHGPIIKSVLTIVAIWLYAAMAGFTPSIVRAAVMFTLLQISFLRGRSTQPLNRVATAACLMLLWQGQWLYDIGFQLSFISVVAIIEWGIPLTRVGIRHNNTVSKAKHEARRFHRLRSKWGWAEHLISRLGRGVWSAMVVTIVATVATMPLVSKIFGAVSLWGLLVGPPMVWLCSIVVGGTMLWVVFAPLLPTTLMRIIIETSTEAMNSLAAWCASHPALVFDIRISEGLCWLIYIVFVLLTIALWGINQPER